LICKIVTYVAILFTTIKDNFIAFEFIHISFDFIHLDGVPLITFNALERDLRMSLNEVIENFRKIKILSNSNDSIELFSFLSIFVSI
jgi:hypothetical protein